MVIVRSFFICTISPYTTFSISPFPSDVAQASGQQQIRFYKVTSVLTVAGSESFCRSALSANHPNSINIQGSLPMLAFGFPSIVTAYFDLFPRCSRFFAMISSVFLISAFISSSSISSISLLLFARAPGLSPGRLGLARPCSSSRSPV
jgi:hypothetical protein